jgi:hypothetical protein
MTDGEGVEEKDDMRSGEPIGDSSPALLALVGWIEFVDAANVYWRVKERNSGADPGARGARCLVFSSEQAVRRVWVYPPEWRTLSNASLIELCSSPG